MTNDQTIPKLKPIPGMSGRSSSRKLIELQAEFDYEKYVFGQGDSRSIIGVLQDGQIVKGRCPEGRLECGLTYRFLGMWVVHEKWGRQFQFQSATLATPKGQRGVVAYVQRASGIGKRKAVKLWDAFGEQTLEVVRTDPARVAAAIGISEAKAEEASRYFSSLAGMEATTVDLTDLLSGRGFPRTLADSLLREFGNEAPGVVRDNPYILMKFKGVGFLRADQLYLELGKPAAAIERQAYCVWHAIASDSEGHTWYPLGVAGDALRRNVDGAAVDEPAAIVEAIGRELVVRCQSFGGDWIAETAKADAERRLAGYLVAAEMESAALAAEGKPSRWPDAMTIQGIDGQQPIELAKATAGTLGILAGRPGTGKTHTLAAMIRAMGARRIAVCAPTGKAAVRATESLAKSGCNLVATTIHRLLGVESAEGGWKFRHGPDCLLPLDYIIVDEASMIDTPLMASLLAARASGCHVLFVGDPGQLAPVGHGAPLRDMMAAGVPHGLLTEIRRNSGQIVQTCKAIAERLRFPVSPFLDPKEGKNLVVYPTTDPSQQIDTLATVLEKIRAAGRYDPVEDVQILVAVNEKSPLGRKALNKLLQGVLNADGERADGNPFRIGDKIICTQNGYLPSEGDQAEADAEGRVYVANGELARVQEVAPLFTVAKLANPDRLVRIPRGRGDEEGDTGCAWELGYAISTHKSQGSEWPIILLMLDSYPGAVRLMDRHFIYTAISRAREMCLCIGKKEIAEKAVLRSSMWARKTFLREWIEELRTANLATAWQGMLQEAAS